MIGNRSFGLPDAWPCPTKCNHASERGPDAHQPAGVQTIEAGFAPEKRNEVRIRQHREARSFPRPREDWPPRRERRGAKRAAQITLDQMGDHTPCSCAFLGDPVLRRIRQPVQLRPLAVERDRDHAPASGPYVSNKRGAVVLTEESRVQRGAGFRPRYQTEGLENPGPQNGRCPGCTPGWFCCDGAFTHGIFRFPELRTLSNSGCRSIRLQPRTPHRRRSAFKRVFYTRPAKYPLRESGNRAGSRFQAHGVRSNWVLRPFST